MAQFFPSSSKIYIYIYEPLDPKRVLMSFDKILRKTRLKVRASNFTKFMSCARFSTFDGGFFPLIVPSSVCT